MVTNRTKNLSGLCASAAKEYSTMTKQSKPKAMAIREAVLAHHGGLEDATDEQVRRVWDSLSPADRERYLAKPANKFTAEDAENAENRADS